MGLAASQARFLQCTARKTNVEYQGQQINNARTVLANKSANAYNEMLALKVPTPPSQADYTKVQYAFKLPGSSTKTYLSEDEYNTIYKAMTAENTPTNYADNNSPSDNSGSYRYSTKKTITIDGTEYFIACRIEAGTDDSTYPSSINKNSQAISRVWFGTAQFNPSAANIGNSYNDGCSALSVEETVDEIGYEDAYNQYKYEQYLYEQECQNINAETSVILQQDKVLELQLKQLDTEQSALKTELEALDKVIGDHVESEFKTFGG